jgi:hypothetical protein
MRDNVEAESPEDYFRKSITVPFLYYTLNEMKKRFTNVNTLRDIFMTDWKNNLVFLYLKP